MTLSFIVHRFTEGHRIIGVADTLAAETIVHQLNSLPLLGGGSVRAEPVDVLTLNDAKAIAEFIEEHTA